MVETDDSDNSDLLEAYFQAVVSDGKADEIREFLNIAAETQGDISFRARLRSSNMTLYQTATKPTAPNPQQSFREIVKELTEIINDKQLRKFVQRRQICDILARKYPETLAHLREKNADESGVIFISLSDKVHEWVREQIRMGLFRDRAEAVEYALAQYVEKSK